MVWCAGVGCRAMMFTFPSSGMDRAARARLSKAQRNRQDQLAELRTVPLLRRYILARVDLGVEFWRTATQRVGIIGLTVDGGQPHQCSPRLLAQFRRLEADHGGAIPGTMPVAELFTLVLGERVRIVDGPFATFDGTVSELDEFRARAPIGRIVRSRDAGCARSRSSDKALKHSPNWSATKMTEINGGAMNCTGQSPRGRFVVRGSSIKTH